MAKSFTRLLQFGVHLVEKGQKAETVQMKRLEKVANKFNLEMKVNTRDVPGRSKDEQVQLNPSDATFERIERWQAIHIEKPDFPYDADAIRNQDWNEMYNLFYDEDGNEKQSLSEENIARLHD